MIHFLSIVILSLIAFACTLAIATLLYSISVIAFKFVIMCWFLWLLISVINYISAKK
jgi:hypothetical protein